MILLLLFACFTTTFSLVSAQSLKSVEILKLDISTYPDVTVEFRAINDDGSFDKNVSLDSVHVIEDRQVITPDSLELLEPGMRLVVAFNEDPKLANRYAQVSRIDKIRNALIEWANTKTITTMDDFSLVGNSGAVASNLTDPAEWVQALTNYQPDLKAATPGLTSLSTAIDLSITNVGHEKTPAILYITPLPSQDQLAGLQDLLSRASLGGVRMFVLLVGPQEYASKDEAQSLRVAAEKSGGQFVVFTGMDDAPDFSQFFDPLTFVYQAVYHSRIKNAGDYSLAVRINRDQNLYESDPISFRLNVAAPNPIFVAPPAKVERSWSETKRRKDSVLTPNTYPIEIMVEFPDGLKRDLVYSRFFVDNQMVAENTAAPFEKFDWDISSLTESGEHVISASIEDSAGFIVQTVNLPVEVVVQPKPRSWFGKLFARFSLPTIGLSLVIAAAGLYLVLLALRALRKNQGDKQARTRKLEDPLTQPVMIENEIIHPKKGAEVEDPWPHIPGLGLAPARLILQSSDEKSASLPAEIPLGEGTLTFGSDIKKAKIVLTSAAVSPLHARILQDEEDQYKVFDEGSGSGTWLNYAPVSQQYGARLKHGDLIQFGPIAFRFELYGSQPPRMRVYPIEDEG